MNAVQDRSWPRSVYEPRNRAADQSLAIFAGVYGQRWIDNVIENLERQSQIPLRVLVAINGPSDFALSELLAYQQRSVHEVWIVQNSSNLGPWGSFARNHDLISADWVAFLHQDDIYLANHIPTLRSLTSQVSNSTLGVFTTLGSADDSGRRRGLPPPIENRHLRSAPSHILVPAIIQRHAFPTPAFAVRSRAAVPDIPWYDSGAPDSEWFARLACQGTLDASDEVTVLYRQPSDSESSATDTPTRAWLWSQSLTRTIRSPEFREMVTHMPTGVRREFARSLLQAIPARYPDSPIFQFVRYLAAQEMLSAWDYEGGPAADLIRAVLDEWAPSGATRTLDDLFGRAPLGSDSAAAASVAALMGHPQSTSAWEERGRKAYRSYGHLLPKRVTQHMVGAYRKLRKASS